MFPINGIITGVLFAATSRVARGEFQISEDAHKGLNDLRDKLEEMSELVGDFQLSTPGTWGRFAGRFMDRSFATTRRFESAREALTENGFSTSLSIPPFLIDFIAQNAPRTQQLFESEEGAVDLLLLGPDLLLAYEHYHSHSEENRLYYDPKEQPREAFLPSIATLFWADQNAAMIDMAAEKLHSQPFDLSPYHYHGQRLEHIQEWQAFRDAGLRRNILLQGPPGSGKTTLCCQAARTLSSRTLLLSPECIAEIRLTDWIDLLAILQPEMVILDDVDRIDALNRYALQEKLRFFEEGYCNVPFVLFTSNDHSRLPEAIRRPGRIDQIIQFDEPSPLVRRAIIEKLAANVGVEIPDEHLPFLLAILDEYSPAHVLEALRRARVVGFHQLVKEGDQTFRLHRDFTNEAEWLKVHGFRQIFSEAEFLFRELLAIGDASLAYRDEHSRLFRVELPNGAELCIDRDTPYNGLNVYLRDEIDGREKITAGMAELFWKDRRAVILDYMETKGAVCQNLDLNEHDYYGPLLAGIDRWKQFHDAGLRRNILIQGPPGCGKSTFCLHAARKLSRRTILLTPDLYQFLSFTLWSEIIEFLQPDMVIIDDVDRVAEYSLESKLRLFEEGHCLIPYVLFTSNDHLRLPEPMRRPGRIDQIIEMDTPDREIRFKLLEELASRVGVDVHEDHLEMLDQLLQAKSNAHVIERLRRAKICGWDAEPLPGDKTFPDPDAPDSPSPESLNGAFAHDDYYPAE